MLGVAAGAFAATHPALALAQDGPKGGPAPAAQPAPPCAEASAGAACREEFERRKVSVSIRMSRQQDGTPVYYGRFEAAGKELSYKLFAASYAAETGSRDAEKFRRPDTTAFFYTGLTGLGVGLTSALAGGVVILATSSKSSARNVGWGLLAVGGVAIPATYLVMAGGDPSTNAYSFPVEDAKRLATEYNAALAKRLGCCGALGPASEPGSAGPRAGDRAPEHRRAPAGATRILPIIGPTSVGVVVRF